MHCLEVRPEVVCQTLCERAKTMKGTECLRIDFVIPGFTRISRKETLLACVRRFDLSRRSVLPI